MMFWVASGGLALAVAVLMALAVSRGRRDSGPSARHDLGVYRDQLAEIDRDAARGIVGAEEADRLRNEVKRRILEADRAARRAEAAAALRGRGNRAAAVVLIAAMVAGAFGVYMRLGAPGYPDMPLSARIAEAEAIRATRPGQEAAEAEFAARTTDGAAAAAAAAAAAQNMEPEFLELIAQLRVATRARPDDLQGHVLLARNEARLGNFAAARAAQARVVDLLGDDVEPADLAALLDLTVRAAGGYVSPEAEAVMEGLLARDPANGTARFYAGLLEGQTGRPDRAFRIWRVLLEQSPPDAPWVPVIRDRIVELGRIAGVRYVPPAEGAAPLRGPTAGDMAAAEDMSPTARMEMIRGMVGTLSARLAAEGGSPAEWAQLIRAYGVLGNTGQAAAIWTEAQRVFADPGAIDTIRRAAQDAGVAN